MEKHASNKEIVESKEILGQIYRKVDCKEFYKLCIEGDHQRSVCLEYKLNKYILGDNSKKKGEIPPWHEYLVTAYSNFVHPMTQELKKIMQQYKILNEGELFCTTLLYNLDDENHSKIIGDPGNKDEDAVNALNKKLKDVQEKYSDKLRIMFDQNKAVNKEDFAKAVYFASYYNKKNEDFDSYMAKYFYLLFSQGKQQESNNILAFDKLWNQKRQEEGFDEEFHDKMQVFSAYKKKIKKTKNAASDDKLMHILNHKQFFSVPWLICFKEYLY